MHTATEQKEVEVEKTVNLKADQPSPADIMKLRQARFGTDLSGVVDTQHAAKVIFDFLGKEE